MKLPMRVIETIRGPILAAALAGCASQTPTEPLRTQLTPEPTPAPTQVAAIDPVRYDPATESERLARLDQTEASDERAREERLEDEAASHRPPPLQSDPSTIGIGQPRYDIMAACGRG